MQRKTKKNIFLSHPRPSVSWCCCCYVVGNQNRNQSIASIHFSCEKREALPRRYWTDNRKSIYQINRKHSPRHQYLNCSLRKFIKTHRSFNDERERNVNPLTFQSTNFFSILVLSFLILTLRCRSTTWKLPTFFAIHLYPRQSLKRTQVQVKKWLHEGKLFLSWMN